MRCPRDIRIALPDDLSASVDRNGFTVRELAKNTGSADAQQIYYAACPGP
jgi:hypothetical protein